MTRPPTIHEAVTRNLEKYFQDLNGTQPALIYDMVLSAVEKPTSLDNEPQNSMPPPFLLIWKTTLAWPPAAK